MSERSRKRSSKWDLKQGHPLSPENTRGHGRDLDKLAAWDEDGGYSMRMSPGFSDWRRQNHRHSPREKCDRSARNRSRSQSMSRSPVRGFRQESGNYDRNRSRSVALCRDFGAGRCRRGSDCPFVHQNSRNYDGNWEDRHRKGGILKYSTTRDAVEYPSRSSSELEREWNRSNNTLCKFFAAGNCQSGKYCRFSHGKTSESPRRKMDEANKYWEDPRLKGTGPVPNAGKLGDGNGRGTLDWRVNDRCLDGRRDPYYEKENRVLNDSAAGASSVIPPEPRSSDKVLDDAAMSPDWNYSLKSSNHAKDELQYSTYSSPVPTSLLPIRGPDSAWNSSGRTNHSPSVSREMRFDNPGSSQSNLNFSSNVLHGQGFDQNQQNLSAIALPNLNPVGQGNVAMPVDLCRGVSSNESKIGMPLAGTLVEDAIASQITVIPSSNNAVGGEQLTQLTNISASIAQLLEAGKQCPQVYTALSVPQPPVDPVDQAKPVLSNVSVVPNEHYGPLSDSTEQKEDNIDGLNRAADGEQIYGSNTGGPNQVLPFETHDGKDSAEEAVEGNKKVDVSKEASNSDKKDKENVDGVKKTEHGKKNKETKSVRAFKFALAEFAKELLKPTWKDGLVGKEAYKTIVKKVVSKVTGSLQGANIPHSQEKIEQYLSTSKPKLTKLVQAYVDKFQKSSK